MLKPEEIWAIFEKTEALLSGHFKLTSGKHSDYYVQCAKVLQYPLETAKLAEELLHRLDLGEIEAVVGPATGGIVLAYELARQLEVKAMFTERQEGVMTLRRGFAVEKGHRVLAVEDVVTTGGSLAETIAVLQKMGAEVVACAALVDRSGGKIKFNLPFVPLLTMKTNIYDPQDCPLCGEGIPAVKPGSRKES